MEKKQGSTTEFISYCYYGTNNTRLYISLPHQYGTLQMIQSPTTENDITIAKELLTSQVELGFTRVDSSPNDGRLASLQPTMWLGSQNGWSVLFVILYRKHSDT